MNDSEDLRGCAGILYTFMITVSAITGFVLPIFTGNLLWLICPAIILGSWIIAYRHCKRH